MIDEITDPNVIKHVTPTSCGAACGQMLLKDRNIFVNQTKLGTSLKSPEQLARDLSQVEIGTVVLLVSKLLMH